MYVDSEFERNADVDSGAEAHEKAEKRSDRISIPLDALDVDAPPKNLRFYSEGLLFAGELDAIKLRNGEWIPYEAKKSAAPESGKSQQWKGFSLSP